MTIKKTMKLKDFPGITVLNGDPDQEIEVECSEKQEPTDRPRGRCEACRRKDVPLVQPPSKTPVALEGGHLKLDDDRPSFARIQIIWSDNMFDGPKTICTDCLAQHLEQLKDKFTG